MEKPRIDKITIIHHDELLDNADWGVGVSAAAKVSYPTGNGNRRIERLTSGGLHGIEVENTPAGRDYVRDIECEQLTDLKFHLQQFNVNVDNFDELAMTPDYA